MKRNWTKHRQTIKVLSGLLLLATFFMPVASCDKPIPKPLPEPSQAELREQKTEDQNVVLDIQKGEKIKLYYPYKSFDTKNVGSWKELLGFMWPLPILALQILFRNKKRVIILSFIGLVLSVWSALVIFGIVMFKKMLFAGYLASIAVGCLFLVYLCEVAPVSWNFIRARLRFLKRH